MPSPGIGLEAELAPPWLVLQRLPSMAIRRDMARMLGHRFGNAYLQRALTAEAYNAAADQLQIQREEVEKPPKPLAPQANAAGQFLSKYRHVVFGAGEVLDADEAAEGLAAYVGGHGQRDYAFVRAVIAAAGSDLEDNLAAALVERLWKTTGLSVFTLTSEGRAMLHVLYEAIMTGSVSSFEGKQGERILQTLAGGVSEATLVESLQHLMIFPIRSPGMFHLDWIMFKAELRTNGKVWVKYSSVHVSDRPYDKDYDTLRPPPGSPQHDRRVESQGLELPPQQIVAVRLYDKGANSQPIVMPALGLIDYSNQMEHKTLNLAANAFALGLTVEDPLSWGIFLSTEVIDEYRDWIVE
jgi:hypothetical protein